MSPIAGSPPRYFRGHLLRFECFKAVWSERPPTRAGRRKDRFPVGVATEYHPAVLRQAFSVNAALRRSTFARTSPRGRGAAGSRGVVMNRSVPIHRSQYSHFAWRTRRPRILGASSAPSDSRATPVGGLFCHAAANSSRAVGHPSWRAVSPSANSCRHGDRGRLRCGSGRPGARQSYGTEAPRGNGERILFGDPRKYGESRHPWRVEPKVPGGEGCGRPSSKRHVFKCFVIGGIQIISRRHPPAPGRTASAERRISTIAASSKRRRTDGRWSSSKA